ncbi:MAG: hypothetical protein FWE60_04190, partial [Oscillospiraceae bacterium]|nr:hypothetical protein [Oscillospiraceae bacterium]
MKIIKSHTYNIINPEPFEIPFPLVFELLSGNTLLVEYTISETGVVDYSFNPNTNEKILTSVRRALTLNDIFFLFTSRIFPDKTPYTAMEMERFEIYEYQPYNIIRKTRGMLPGDKYWLRFEGESINYKTALDEHRAYYERSYKRYMDALEAAQTESEATPPSPLQGGESDDAEVPESTIAQEVSAVLASEADSDVMSEDMIASLLSTLGDEVGEATTPPVPAETAPAEGIHEEVHELTDDEVGEILKHTKEANGVEVKMSEDEIAALLAANSAPADEGDAPSESEGRMFEPDSGTHEKMSDDA